MGVGYLTSQSNVADGPPPGASLSGASVPLGLAVAGAVAENWILAGEAWGGFTSTTLEGVTSTLFVYGYSLGLVVYVMPANVHLSLSPGIARVSIERGNTSASTDYGPAVKMGIGKEWWVSDHWGLGIAGQFSLCFNKEARTTLAGGLTFSATYN